VMWLVVCPFRQAGQLVEPLQAALGHRIPCSRTG
jgi:hypothetical protein